MPACNVAERLRDLRAPAATAHERYARALTDAGLDSTALGRDWLVAADSVLRAPHRISLPFRESGYFTRSEARAVAYRLTLAGGERLSVQVRSWGLPALLFLDLFEVPSDTSRGIVHRRTSTSDSFASADGAEEDSVPGRALLLDFEAERPGTFLLRLQPELLRDGRFEMVVQRSPILAFPVEGHGNRAVQSFFGADRDAGRRQHHGIDIFAPHGTPVLAATDGVVRSTSPNELGGNVVWLSDGGRNQSLYYAHLDRHAVVPGDQVRVGDTLGFVGNTGNARSTRPHLHFGIYRRGEGPVDPYPWVRLVTDEAPRVTADTSLLGRAVRTTVASAPVLDSPAPRGDTVRRIPRATALAVVGATGAWYRVQLADGVSGYVVARATAPLSADTGRPSGGTSAEGARILGAPPSHGGSR